MAVNLKSVLQFLLPELHSKIHFLYHHFLLLLVYALFSALHYMNIIYSVVYGRGIFGTDVHCNQMWRIIQTSSHPLAMLRMLSTR